VNLLFDIFSVLKEHWKLLAGMVLMIVFGQILIRCALRMIFRDRLASEDYFALSAAGWMLPLSMASVLWLAFGMFLPVQAGALLFMLLAAILALVLFLRARREPVPASKAILWLLLVVFGASIFLRLAFVSRVILPLYFDSAQHYQITSNLIRSLVSNQSPLLSPPTGMYYHTGFHFMTAWMASIMRVDILDVILILGQVIVAALPLSMFPIIKQETQSGVAAVFAVLLAAFGWYMPAYAVNWGKYPALTSLPLITFVMSLTYLLLRYRHSLSRRQSLGLCALLFLGILITVLFHSRAVIVLGILAVAWTIATGWQRLTLWLRGIAFFAALLGIGLIIMFVRTKDVFGLLFDPYWEKGVVVTTVVLFLAIFAQWRYPRLAFASILAILLLFGGLLVPVNVPGYGNLTLLDRPFVEMILYLPLSLLGGAGLAGLEKSLRDLTARWQAKRFLLIPSLSSLFIVLLLANAFVHYTVYPADCCSIVGRDDLVAIDWMDKNLPPDARIAISSTELHVLDTSAPQGAAGGDAGAWITPLTDRVTIALPYQSDFSQQAIFDTLCQWGTGYLFVGEAGASFNNGLLSAYPDRYRILLSMPRAKVYQLTGCAQPQ
jgi:hypothetical protein